MPKPKYQAAIETVEQAMKNNQAATENLVLNLPNVISALRMAMVPVLIWLALEHKGSAFLMVLAASLLTDAVDGYLARRLNQVTELGAQLDSWADMTTYGTMLLGLWLIWPEILLRESIYVVIAFSVWLMPLLVCQARFGCFPNYHTVAAKVAALSIAPAYFIVAIFDQPLPFRAVAIFYIWVTVEQVIITSILPRWQGNIAGFWRALEIAREEDRAKSDAESGSGS